MNYYFDMDGVLVRYDRSAYEGADPIWKRPGAHYFRDLEEDPKMAAVFRTILASRDSYDTVRVVSSVCSLGAVYLEHCRDKLRWLTNEDRFPNLRETDFIPTVGPKAHAIQTLLRRNLTPEDILIDDFNRNLRDWQAAGGTAVKYCNSINSEHSFDGFTITSDMVVPDILSFLRMITTQIRTIR